MPNLQQTLKDTNVGDHRQIPLFTAPVKFGSAELDLVINEIEKDAADRRKAGSDARPYYAMELIKKARLGALRIPSELGGGGASIRQLFQVVIRIAEADPDVAHILRAHFSHVENFLISDDIKQRETWIKRILNGAIIGNAVTEISTNNVGSLVYETTITPDGADYRLNGIKYFSTGTMYSDWVFILASNAEGKPISMYIPLEREGLEIEDDWDGIGQKLTGSGTTRFNHVLVKSEEAALLMEEKTPFNSYIQLYLHSVIAGILQSVVKDSKNLVLNRKRSFSFAAAETPAQDPQLQEIIGELSSIAYAAESLILTAADALDVAANSAINGNIPYALSHEASLQAAKVKVILDKLALKSATQLFDVGGASATKRSAQLDRHWRNIRTLASHNPTVYKARAIGDYVVNGNELPINQVYF